MEIIKRAICIVFYTSPLSMSNSFSSEYSCGANWDINFAIKVPAKFNEYIYENIYDRHVKIHRYIL